MERVFVAAKQGGEANWLKPSTPKQVVWFIFGMERGLLSPSRAVRQIGKRPWILEGKNGN